MTSRDDGKNGRGAAIHALVSGQHRMQMALLGAVLMEARTNEGRSPLLAELDVETDDFTDPRALHLFNALRNLEARGLPIELASIEAELERTGKLGIVGLAYVGEVALQATTVDAAKMYAGELRETSYRRALIRIGGYLSQSATNTDSPIEEILYEHHGELGRFLERRQTPGAEEIAKARWCTPLSSFLGNEEEPSDDDAEDWIIRDVVPRAESGLIAGPAKSGKTWKTLDLAISIATGQPWLGGAFENTMGAPARVLVIALEDSKRRLRKRLWELCRARGITPNDERLRENLFISQEPLRIPDRADQKRLVAELRRTKAVAALIDNLTRVMVGDQNSVRDAAAFTKEWTHLGQDAGSSIVFLHHTAKTGIPVRGSGDDGAVERDPFDSVRGSGDLVAAARNIVVMRPLSVEGRHITEARIRGNLDLRREALALEFARVKRDEDGRWVARLTDAGDPALLRVEVKKKGSEEKKKAKAAERQAEYRRRRDVVLRLVGEHGHITGAMAKAGLECSLNTAQAFLKELLDEGVIARSADRNRGYELPAGGAP